MAWRVEDWKEREPTESLIADQFSLRTFLEEASIGRPRIFIVRSDQGELIRIGIGGSLGFLTWYRGPFKENVAYPLAESPVGTDPIEFRMGWECIEAYPEKLIPANQLIDVLLEIFVQGSLSPRVRWRIWDHTAQVWEIRDPLET